MASALDQTVRGWTERIRAGDDRAVWRFDLGFAVLLTVIGVAAHLTAPVDGGGWERDPDALSIGLLLAAGAALVWRRTRPVPVALIVTGLTIVFWVSNFASYADPPALFAIYALTANGLDRRRVWQVAAVCIGALTVTSVIGVIIPNEDLPAIAVLGIIVIAVTAALLGQTVWSRRQRLADLEERVAQAERERELALQQAVSDERARIAREMHDVVAHSMTVMVVQAGAAERLVRSDPGAAAAAMGAIREQGREALTEMRRTLGALRGDDSPARLDPPPTLADLDRLVETFRDAGTQVALHVSGDRGRLPIGVEIAAYRTVQEALTNAVKHGGPAASVSVRILHEAEAVQLEVADDGLGPLHWPPESTGHGLVGMRERAELFGGHLDAGPRPGGGFVVRARLSAAPVPSAGGAAR